MAEKRYDIQATYKVNPLLGKSFEINSVLCTGSYDKMVSEFWQFTNHCQGAIKFDQSDESVIARAKRAFKDETGYNPFTHRIIGGDRKVSNLELKLVDGDGIQVKQFHAKQKQNGCEYASFAILGKSV